MAAVDPLPQQSLTAHKIPILKKGEYDLWAMKMRHYIAITDHVLWDVIQQGNHVEQGPAKPIGDNGEMVTLLKWRPHLLREGIKRKLLISCYQQYQTFIL